MEIASVVSVFEKYGWPGILMLIAIGIIYLFFKKINISLNENVNQGMDNLAKSLSEQNEKLLISMNEQNNKMINFLIENSKSESHQTSLLHNEKLKERMQITETINNKLKDIMNYTNSQRVTILEFHNSNANLIGIPFAKFSITYEWLRQRVKPIQNMLKSIPFSTISSVVQDVVDSKNSQVIYNNMAQIVQKNPALCSILETTKAKSVMFIGIYDIKNHLLGLLAIEFTTTVPDYINQDEIAKDVIEISSLINLNYKYDEID